MDAFKHVTEHDQAGAYHEIDKLWKLKGRNERRDHHEDQSASDPVRFVRIWTIESRAKTHFTRGVAGIADDRKGFEFCTPNGHHGGELTVEPMGQPDASRTIGKQGAAVGIFSR